MFLGTQTWQHPPATSHRFPPECEVGWPHFASESSRMRPIKQRSALKTGDMFLMLKDAEMSRELLHHQGVAAPRTTR